MKKKNFVKIMKGIIDQIERERSLTNYLSPFFGGHITSEISSDLQLKIIDALENEMRKPSEEDNHETWIIRWWLFDAPEAGKNKDGAYVKNPDGSIIILETPEQLYDHLTGF